MWIVLLAILQQPPTLPTATQLNSLEWDYADSQLSNGRVDHFRATFDSDEPIDVPLSSRVPDSDTYRLLLPRLAVGEHVVKVVACDATPACSFPASLKFTFRVQQDPVTNLRLGTSGGQ